ncbi:diguanylate cyclase [Mitsuaria sp. WAJ17]|uniref:diguanylate cyclase n=1 Tax=Mitsuaria sp. WAJ17 TaxID=2761452 RepID=UPI001603E034|nr:diguanylate cyclase [Mitsuaria sp. WAJ17]
MEHAPDTPAMELAEQRLRNTVDRFMHRFLAAWLLATGGVCILEMFFTGSVQPPALSGFGVGLVARVILLIGRPQFARIFFISASCIAVAVLPAFISGVRSPFLAVIPVMVLAAGWLLGQRLMLFVTGGLVLVVLGYFTAEAMGWSTVALPQRPPQYFALAWLGVAVLAAICTSAILANTNLAIESELNFSLNLRRSERQLRAVLATLQDGVILVSDAAVVEFVNQRLCEQFSLTEAPEALVGLSAKEMITKIQSMYFDPEAAIARIVELASIGKPCLGEEIKLRNGRTLLRDYMPFDYGDGRLGRVWQHRDVTALRDAQTQLEQANRNLAIQSTTDALTGLANRRQFDDVLGLEWARCQRHGRPLTLILLDVDWFKRYNDCYGHQPGDDCLRAVATAIKSSVCRASDLAARYGGEEFAIIAPEAVLSEGVALAEKVRASVRDLAMPHNGSSMGVVTISLGVATFVPHDRLEISSLIRAADLALYSAKEAGRDRVHGGETGAPE